MRMKVPKMDLRVFLELSRGLRQDPRFALSNQDVESGFVKFRNEERLNALKDLLIYHNRGIIPYSTVVRIAKTSQQMKAIGFEYNAWKATLESVRYKANSNGVDWYVAKCPACSADKPKGEDTKGHRLNFSTEGAAVCQARQCTYWEIIGKDKKPVTEEEMEE